MVVNNAISLLGDLGLSDYESRAYFALLQHQPTTAYDLAKKSGIPSSKIYETLNRLVDKGIALPHGKSSSRGQRYSALNPEDMTQEIRDRTEEKTRRLSELLSNINNERGEDFIWPLNTQERIDHKVIELIRSATSSCLISLWPEELERYQRALEEAIDRGIKIALVHFGRPQIKLGATYYHPAEKTLYEEKGGRGLTLVCDSNSVVIATFFKSGELEGSWSQNRTFVTVAEDYIRHDIYITKVTDRLDHQVKNCFGKNYEYLRDIYYQGESG